MNILKFISGIYRSIYPKTSDQLLKDLQKEHKKHVKAIEKRYPGYSNSYDITDVGTNFLRNASYNTRVEQFRSNNDSPYGYTINPEIGENNKKLLEAKLKNHDEDTRY